MSRVFYGVSHALSRLLRHTGAEWRSPRPLPCAGGWFRIADILSLPSTQWSLDETLPLPLLLSVVKDNAKPRFQIAIQRIPKNAALKIAHSGPRIAGTWESSETDELRSYHFAIRACSGRSYPFIDTDLSLIHI